MNHLFIYLEKTKAKSGQNPTKADKFYLVFFEKGYKGVQILQL